METENKQERPENREEELDAKVRIADVTDGCKVAGGGGAGATLLVVLVVAASLIVKEVVGAIAERSCSNCIWI